MDCPDFASAAEAREWLYSDLAHPEEVATAMWEAAGCLVTVDDGAGTTTTTADCAGARGVATETSYGSDHHDYLDGLARTWEAAVKLESGDGAVFERSRTDERNSWSNIEELAVDSAAGELFSADGTSRRFQVDYEMSAFYGGIHWTSTFESTYAWKLDGCAVQLDFGWLSDDGWARYTWTFTTPTHTVEVNDWTCFDWSTYLDGYYIASVDGGRRRIVAVDTWEELGGDPDDDGDGWSVVLGDCDDADPARHPCSDASEADGIDHDCSGGLDYQWPVDTDGDGVDDAEDCEPTNPDVYPDAGETCNGADDDCDGWVDENADEEVSWYPDEDGDGYGESDGRELECDAPGEAWVRQGGDCDDANDDVYPGAVELCDDGLDGNCDGLADDSPSVFAECVERERRCGGAAWIFVAGALAARWRRNRDGR